MGQPCERTKQEVARLYESYHQPILRYLERLSGSRELAEDLAQETFLKALCRWEQLADARSAAAWLFRIARHTAFDEHRRRRRRPSVPLTESHGDDLLGGCAALAVEDTAAIRAVLGRVYERYRLALLLHSYAGYPVDLIAARLGVKAGTVKSRLARARAQFRQHYAA